MINLIIFLLLFIPKEYMVTSCSGDVSGKVTITDYWVTLQTCQSDTMFVYEIQTDKVKKLKEETVLPIEKNVTVKINSKLKQIIFYEESSTKCFYYR